MLAAPSVPSPRQPTTRTPPAPPSAGCRRACSTSPSALREGSGAGNGRGQVHDRVTTASAEAQAFYDQGVAYLALLRLDRGRALLPPGAAPRPEARARAPGPVARRDRDSRTRRRRGASCELAKALAPAAQRRASAGASRIRRAQLDALDDLSERRKSRRLQAGASTTPSARTWTTSSSGCCAATPRRPNAAGPRPARRRVLDRLLRARAPAQPRSPGRPPLPRPFLRDDRPHRRRARARRGLRAPRAARARTRTTCGRTTCAAWAAPTTRSPSS